MTNEKAPNWLLKREGITNRQWKAKKRAELKEVITAFDKYRMGCAYCPDSDGKILQIDIALEELKDSHSAKKWVR